MRYGIAKNEMVATSNKKPITKVFAKVNRFLSTSEKFQTRKLNLTMNDKIKNKLM